MNQRAMSVGVRLFEPPDYLGTTFLFVGDHEAKAKKERGKMQIWDCLGRI